MPQARAYQVDELLKLRRLCKVSSDVLRRINSEAGIKEHVLRSCSNSSDPFPFRSRQRSSSIITNPYDGYEIPAASNLVPFKSNPSGHSVLPVKISPTPSMKRGKAERLLKEHGSPPGVRVTAGGRIVPDGLTPITSPRAQQRHGLGSQQLAHISIPRVDLRNLPSLSYLQSVEGYLVLGEGQIFQVHNGHLVPVGRVGNPALNLVCPPANQTMAPGTQYGPGVDYQIPLHQMASSFYPPNPEHEAIDQHTLSKLDECHSKFQEELRELDRNEVLQRDSLTASGKREIVRRRIELVNRIDETRRSILRARRVLKDRAASGTVTSPPPSNSQVPSMAMASQHYMSAPAPIDYGYAASYPFAGPDYQQYAMMTASMPHQALAYGVPPLTPSVHAGAELVPLHAQHDYPVAANLQSRAGNAGLGISSSSLVPNEDGYAPGKGQEVSFGPKSINLDGSGHQPRRSHAVTIKAPEPGSKEKKMMLNPNSQSYRPRNANDEEMRDDEAAKHAGDARASSFMPSAAMVAGVDRLVGSPQRAHASLEKSDSTSKYGASSSTASTSDFFPQDTDEYSANKHAYKGCSQNGNLGGWMVEESDAEAQSTPKRAVSKHMWSTSPGEHFFDAMPDHDGRPQTAFAAASSPIHRSQGTGISSLLDGGKCGDQGITNTQLSPGRSHGLNVSGRGHSHEATVIGGDSPRGGVTGSRGIRASSMHRSDSGTAMNVSPGKRLYRLGLEDGLGNKLDRVHTEFEYLQGLREGLQQRTRQPDEDSGPAAGGVEGGLRSGSVPSITSPTAPVNSPLSTPRSGSSFDGKFSPATALAFSSQPNVKVVDMHRGIGTQTSTARLRGSEQHTSPLTDRHRSPYHDSGRLLSPAESFSARMYRLQLQDKQRGANTNEGMQKHVQVVFPQQDGPPENIEANNNLQLQLQYQHPRRNPHQVSHTASPGVVTQQSGGSSPGKRLSSAAATMLSFGRKLKSPEPVAAEGPRSPGSSKSCSPTKGRSGWRRRIEDKIIPGSSSLSPPK